MNNNKYKVTLEDVFLAIFVVLKLTKLIDWSWIWVLSPVWIGLIFAILVHLIVGED